MTETTQEARPLVAIRQDDAEMLLTVADLYAPRAIPGGAAIALDVAQTIARVRDAAKRGEDGELARLRNACKHMGSVIVSMSRQMECARIEMAQNGPEKAMQWILNGLPDVDDNPPEMHWDGKESADEWFERTADYARSETAK